MFDVNELIVWAPTLLFGVMLLWTFIVGFIRGYRKSTILFFHMLILGGLCLAGYAWLCSIPTLDTDIIKYANQILASNGQSVQSLLDVSAEATSLREIIMELILTNMSQEDLIYHIVNDNAAYIMTMVEMAYRIIFFIATLVIYLVLSFIMYIIYLIFYPVRRTVKKHNKKFKKGLVPHPYKKRRLLGGMVGTFRGCISGIIGFSFLGALLFIATGGTTLPSRDEINEGEVVDFGDETYNQVYDYYSMICDMGDTGVFKVLNNFKDPENVPYYFYVCDLVLQGSVNDPTLGVDETFYLRDEAGNYVRFCKDVMSLIVKYADDDLPLIIKNVSSVNNSITISNPSGEETGDSDTLNVLLKIMSKPGFSEEFGEIIDDFEAKTYFVNLALSTLTSVVNHIDLLDVSEEVKGLVKCMFVDGEHSIKVTDLATEDDVKHLFKSVIKLISNTTVSDDDNQTESTIKLVQYILPEIKKLSCFTDDKRKEEGNLLLGSVYEYCVETFVEDVEIPEIPEDINWIDEFGALLDAVNPMLTIYLNLMETGEEELMSQLAVLFDEENPKAQENEEAYDAMINGLSNSLLLDTLFRTDMVRTSLNEALGMITGNEESEIPMSNLKFNNTKDASGNVIYGETYKFLNSLKVAIKNNLLDLLSGSMSGNGAMRDVFEVLNSEVDENTTLMAKVVESDLLYYFLSGIVTNVVLTDSPVIVPEIVTTTITENEKNFVLINKTELVNFTKVMYDNLDIILPEDDSYLPLKAIITDKDFAEGIDKSIIFEYTFTTMVIDMVCDVDDIVVPEGYDNIDLWVSTRDENLSVVSRGETYNFITGIGGLIPEDASEDSDFEELTTAIRITKENAHYITDSVIMSATASRKILSSQLRVQASVYSNEMIEHEELRDFLIGCVELYGDEENGVKYLSVDNLNLLDICSKEYTKEEVNTIVTSHILSLNFEVTITQKNNIIVPVTIEDEVELVTGESIVKVSDQEFHALVKALFGIRETINLDNIDTKELTLYQSKLDDYLGSEIFKATLSNEISKMRKIIMPEDTYHMVNIHGSDVLKPIINDDELRYLLEGLFALFGEEANDDVALKLDQDLSIRDAAVSDNIKETVERSKILTASIRGY